MSTKTIYEYKYWWAKPNLFPGFVPCLRALLSIGVHEGGRNKAAFQLGVFLQKSRPNDWKSQMEELNVKHFTPLLLLK